jgi:rhodanese-related sulfurtransferase
MRIRTHLRPEAPEPEEGRWARRRGSRGLKIAIALALIVVPPIALAAILYFEGRTMGLDLVREVSGRKFPSVRWITTGELATWLADSTRSQPLLKHMEAFARDTPIVVYCSAGYRSSRVSRWLGRQGFTNVRNLEGSLFAWANEGRPMVSETGAAKEVHPYNEFWGRLLKPEVRSAAPPVTDPYSLP